MDIRAESAGDRDAIYHLTEIAFAPMPFSAGNEADCINRLRADGDLTLSLVAVEAGELVGHIAFSPVKLNGLADNWYGLGPVSALPGRQRTGIGSALIEHGLDQIRALGAHGCILIGDPAYYSRFGFRADGRVTYRDLPSELVQWLAFGSQTPSGVLTFSPGLE
ncbi:N-acetyltransferase [Henriciella sp. AS95]|uniref:GNAT family N-acetyltransferase n=1 Tax=Henriciella sp. AS95 TaxID=3135782 RepID=UPI0031704104